MRVRDAMSTAVLMVGPDHSLREAARRMADRGVGAAEAQSRAVALIGRQVAVQSSYLAYIDVFFVLAMVSAAAVPLALILRNVDMHKGGGGAAH